MQIGRAPGHPALNMVSDAVAKCVGVGEETHENPSFERVYDDYVDFVWRSARRLGVDDAGADDVVQHVFLVVHRRLPEFEGRSTMKTWLFGIVLRAVQDHRRTLRRKSPHLLASGGEPDELPAEGGPEDAFERAEAVAMLDRLLDTLDEQERVVFVMAELEQMTANEIGEATGLDPKAVYSRLRAARTQFERAAERMRTKLAAEERRV
ncbi:MAG TPA: sigma-70 family RNA polymerase sigma factor [Labilithrix sp.]|jgi:RNA polymerase sigma-70 factor (ECF subfamily)